jgi:hypothetical protein
MGAGSWPRLRSRFVSYYRVEEIEKAQQCAIQFVIAEKDGEARVETHRLAQEWFDKYLKGR